MNDLSKENLIPEGQVELDPAIEKFLPLIQPVMFVEFNPEDKHIFKDPRERGDILMNLFTQRVMDYGNEFPFAQYLYQNGIKVAICSHPSDRESNKMAEVFRYLDKWQVISEIWIVLNDNDGCYTNLTNLSKTQKEIEETLVWCNENKIEVKSIGIDLEHNISLHRNITPMEILRYLLMIDSVSEVDIELFNTYLSELRLQGIKINQYRAIKNFGSSKKIRYADEQIFRYYTSVLPSFIANKLIKHLYDPKNEVVATGIMERGKYSDNKLYTPGRLFRNKRTPHLSENDLRRDILATYEKYIKLGLYEENGETLVPMDMYLFALDDPEVARIFKNTIYSVQNQLLDEYLNETSH